MHSRSLFSQKESFFSLSFVAICVANLLLFVAFYFIMPVLPMYLSLEMKAGPVAMGSILAAYTLCALMVRPFAGYVADAYKGKTLFLVTFFLFSLCFAGYLLPASLTLLFFLRAIHGVSFSMVTTSTTVYVVEVLPPARLGAGIGFFGATAALAMALGPSIGMFVLERYSYPVVFASSIGVATLGLAIGLLVRPLPSTSISHKAPLRLKSLFLPVVKKPFIAFALLAFIYGLLLTYISLFAREKGFTLNVGYVFSLMALGLIISRLFAGRFIDGGGLIPLMSAGYFIVIISCFVFTITWHEWLFFGSALFIGLGFGLLMPAFQTIFTTLVAPHERGRSNSLFFSAFDLGIGIAVFFGGVVGEKLGMQTAYLTGVALLVLSFLYFRFFVVAHYEANKVVQ
ncbi:MFS transporter [Desulfovibrio cuneatus]|uniref:MFS transporter n=1 Tax=Desulfovibrio cuneatus TaxID=159728 RepID=UPI0005548FBB|nr:MFS transporter [Desulfovibrio cuneatus]